MEPFNQSNFDGIVDRWYQAAENHETDTCSKMQLFHETERAASTLERLVWTGSIEQAKELANIILHSFDSHNNEESEELIGWIGANTLKWGNDVKGAYKLFHHLFEALQTAGSTNSSWKHIDAAAMKLLEKSDASIQGHKHQDQTIPGEVLNQIVHFCVCVHARQHKKTKVNGPKQRISQLS